MTRRVRLASGKKLLSGIISWIMKAAERSGEEPVMMGSTEPLELGDLVGTPPEQTSEGVAWDNFSIP